MIAYDKKSIDALEIRRFALSWFKAGLIDEATREGILNEHPTPFSTTSLFARIGLFLFSYLAASFSAGMFLLFFGTAMDGKIFSGHGSGIIFILFAGVATFVLEMMIREKNLFQSGVDTGLILFAVSNALGGLTILSSGTDLNMGFLFLIAALLLLPYSIRYANAVSAVGAYIAFLGTLFFTVGFLLLPFALMVFSGIVYFVAKRAEAKESLRFWKRCLQSVRLVALLSFYLAGNNFVIQSVSREWMHSGPAFGQNVWISIFFYLFTATVPVLYIWYALQQKDRMVLLAGMILTAASALTFRYYFSLGYPEIALTVAGIILIAIAYFSIKFLSTPRHGLTSRPDLNFKELEALVLVQSFGKSGTVGGPDSGAGFGGGTSGGGGAGGSF